MTKLNNKNCDEIKQKYHLSDSQLDKYTTELLSIYGTSATTSNLIDYIESRNTNHIAKEVSPEVIDDEIEIWHNKKVSGDYYFPMPTYCLNDKKYNAKIFGALMVLSNSGGKELVQFENSRFIYDNSFNTAQLAKDLGIGRTTLEDNIKKLRKLDYNVVEIENTKNGIVYRLNYGKESEINEGEVNKFVTINQKMLKSLVCSFKDNVIKIYCLMNYMCDTNSYTKMSRTWLCKQIGLTPSGKNKTLITEIMTDLELCGYIESHRMQEFVWNEESNKKDPRTPKVYRLRTFEEWKTIRETIKNKPIKSK